MPDFALYLLKVNALLLVVYLLYRLVLLRLTFYTYNRYFLLLGMVSAVLFPLLDLTWLWQEPLQLNTQALVLHRLPAFSASTTAAGPDWWFALGVLYSIGFAAAALRLLLQLSSVARLYMKGKPEAVLGVKVRFSPAVQSPFTFGHTIFMDPAYHNAHELPYLLRHEQVHVQEYHTLDVLVSQLCSVLLWFNPVVWLLSMYLRQNLEFIADSKVLQQVDNRKAYQYSLLRLGHLPQVSALALHFNLNPIKTRIMMMNKKNSKPQLKLHYALFIPVLLSLGLLASTTEASELELSQLQDVKPTERTLTDTIVYFVDGKRTPSQDIKSINPNSIEKIEVLKGEQAKQLASDSDLKGVVKITMKKDNAEVKGKVESTKETAADKVSALPKGGVFVIDGKQASYEQVQSLQPDQIKAVSITKNSEKMVEKYGAKAKNGVVFIFTK